MSVKHAFLALLAEGPRYGYELKSEFERAIGDGLALNIGQVYSTLQRLERNELIKPDGPPDAEGRQSYVVTELGRETVENWMASPIEPAASNRDELSMKVLMPLATNGASAMQIVRTQRVAAMGQLQMLIARKAAPLDSLAARLHLDRMIVIAESQIRWLDLVEQRLEVEGDSLQ